MPMKVCERLSVEERFWSKVNKHTSTGCWEWMAASNGRYGEFWFNYKLVRAHRFSYELHHGTIPERMVVMHICDNTKCVNPNHISIGTHAENMLDRNNKNRQHKPKGEIHPGCKLKEDQVKEIRNKLALGISQRKIAKDYGVNQRTISYIKTGKLWAHVE